MSAPFSLPSPAPAPASTLGTTPLTGTTNLPSLLTSGLSASSNAGEQLLNWMSGNSASCRPTPCACTCTLSPGAILSSAASSKWQITCSAKRPLLPVTTPVAPLAAPLTTRALLPTQAKTPSAVLALPPALIDTPGWINSPAQPRARSPSFTL